MIKENDMVNASKEIEDFISAALAERNADKSASGTENILERVVRFIQSSAERRPFLGLSLVRLAERENILEKDFESRYPRYKAYRNMVQELSRNDYSEWAASVIKGTEKSEFEANVFEYLSKIKDPRYLEEAFSRFVEILNNSDAAGFTAQTSEDAYIIGALSLYIIQFSENSDALKAALGEKANSFISLQDNNLKGVKGLPLNQVFIFFYLKYYGLEQLINKRMENFISAGTRGWDGTTWTMTAVSDLIDYFVSTGQGMSKNFYSLFDENKKNASLRSYIGLQVIKKIGFNDPDLWEILEEVSGREVDLEMITTSYVRGVPQAGQTRRKINFRDEVNETLSAISGRKNVPFEELLAGSLEEISKSGNFIVPRVTAKDVINNEISQLKDQYTHTFISEKNEKWQKKNESLKKLLFFQIFLLIALSLTAFFLFKNKFNKNKNSIMIIIPAVAASLFSLLLSLIINLFVAGS